MIRHREPLDDKGFYIAHCPACGDPMDYCQGHGPIGDPAGAAILDAHDNGDHSDCHWASDCHGGLT